MGCSVSRAHKTWSRSFYSRIFSKQGQVQSRSCEEHGIYLHGNKKKTFDVNRFEASLALKQRLRPTRKWHCLHYRNYKGYGYKLSGQRFLGSFRWTSTSCDWSMVFRATRNQSAVKLGHPENNPRNRFAKGLYPFPL